jgi:hypothetical protein
MEAQANDRMPGRIPVSQPDADKEKAPVPPRNEESRTTQPKPEKPAAPAVKEKKEAPKAEADAAASAPAPVVNTPTPSTGVTMATREMESLGPLTNPLLGSLGNDMWDGSGRAAIHRYIQELPDGSPIRAAQYLTRRVLLTNGDAKMLRNDAAVPEGEDLFTLRIEKLLAIGGYKDAVDLYTLIEGEPSHDRLARAGIIALMFGGAPAQACLEAHAAHRSRLPQPDADVFWPQIDALCTFIKRQSAQNVAPNETIRAALSKEEAAPLDSSKVLSALVNRSNYRHPISTPEDFESLSQMERAVLRGLGRFDYSRLKTQRIDQVAAQNLMLIATDPNVPEATRFTFTMEAARRGLMDAAQLGDFYLSLAANRDDALGIQGQYLALTRADKAPARAAIVKNLLETLDGGETALLALLPFAASVPEVNPAGLSQKTIENGLRLMMQAGVLPPARWVRAWLAAEAGDSEKNREKTLLYLANLLPENLPTESTPFPEDAVKSVLQPPESAEALEIWSLFSGLRRTNALHNVVDTAVYEKLIDLTAPNDYVMPRDGLVEKIREAARNGRLGEVALLSSVVLKDYKTGSTHPGVLKVLLESLETVGLKEEARHIAMGVMLGSKQ